MTNLIAFVVITVITNQPVETPHPNGIERLVTTSIVNQHVITYTNEGIKYSFTNEYISHMKPKRYLRKEEWQEVPFEKASNPFPSPLPTNR